MSTESKALERAKSRILDCLDFDDPTPYLGAWEKLSSIITWKTFQRAMKELREDKKIFSSDGGYRKQWTL